MVKAKYHYKGSPNTWEKSFKSKKEAKEYKDIMAPFTDKFDIEDD